MRIATDGSFKGSRSYEQINDSGGLIYVLKASVKGRFVSTDTAKGTLTFRMTLIGQRGGNPCEPVSFPFVAKRGKNVRSPYLGKNWVPAGQA